MENTENVNQDAVAQSRAEGANLIDELEGIREAMRVLRDAKAMRCICSGFVIQYEGGCCCARGRAINPAKANLERLLEAL
jgi:hypothetical protein